MTTNRTAAETKRTMKVRGVTSHAPDPFTKLTFLAAFPPIQSAIKVGQDGMRIQFDVPETEMGNAVGLLSMREKILKITVEIADIQPVKDKSSEVPSSSKAKLHYGAMSGRKG